MPRPRLRRLPLLLPLLAAIPSCWAEEASTTPKGPAIFSPNPPACAGDVGDILAANGDLWTGVVTETVTCSEELGWTGGTIYGRKQVWFFHHQRQCAMKILTSISMAAMIVSDVLSAAFDCFNDNEACGQAVSGTVMCLLGAASALVKAADVCSPQYNNWPYPFTSDPAVAGFTCWAKVWRVVQRLLKTSKFIDVCITQCQIVAPKPVPIGSIPVPKPIAGGNGTASGAPVPTKAAGGAPVPQPVAAGAGPVPVAAAAPMPVAGGAPIPSSAPHAREGEEAPPGAEELGPADDPASAPSAPNASSAEATQWSKLLQPLPFLRPPALDTQAAERRRLENEGDLSSVANLPALLARLQEIQDRSHRRLAAAGVALPRYEDFLEEDEEIERAFGVEPAAVSLQDAGQDVGEDAWLSV